MIRYFSNITIGKIVLWCYLIWYCITVYFHFDPSIRIWLNSVGISVVIGIALMLSVSRSAANKTEYWQTFRLFMMPFCVSSFSSLIKGQDYIFIFPSRPMELVASVAACTFFVGVVYLIKIRSRKDPTA